MNLKITSSYIVQQIIIIQNNTKHLYSALPQGEKWGIWEAPCREMLEFGGKFAAWREIVPFYTQKHMNLCLN